MTRRLLRRGALIFVVIAGLTAAAGTLRGHDGALAAKA